MISVVIPNFNSGERLGKNLPKLIKFLDASKLEYEVIVADDASTDDSLDILKNYRVITSRTNSGFGTNVDRGIRVAKGEIVFVLNAIDILPAKSDYFALILKHFNDSQVFSVAAAKKDDMGVHGCGEIYFEKGFYLHRRGSGTTSAWADGGAQALRKEYYLKIGGFDPIYKFYWEDVDLGFRARAAGYKIIYEPKAVLIHEKKEGPIAKRYNEKELQILNLTGQYIFTLKNSDLLHKLLFFLWQPYHLAIALKNKDWDWFKACWRVILALLNILPGMTRESI